MEINAALDAARRLDGPLEVVSDSAYVVNCFKRRWWEKWVVNGWVGASRQPVANRDLWEPLVEMYRAVPGRLTFRWVKGHSTDPFNDLVDRLAVAAASSQHGAEGERPPGTGSLGPADAPGERPGTGRAVGAARAVVGRLGEGNGASLRPGQARDAGAVVRLWKLAGARPTTTDDASRVRALVAHDPGALVVAEAGGELVGTLIAGWDGWRVNFYRLVVHPDWRRRGIATALVEAAERRLVESGATRAAAMVVTEDSHAVRFWEAAGYTAQHFMSRHARDLRRGGPSEVPT
jgi:ribosomal protein S18 acetylase RimI-like enzyme